MIEQRPDLRSFDKAQFQWRLYAEGHIDRVLLAFSKEFPLWRVGAHIETPLGWGVIENITSHGSVIVSLFRYRDDPGKQDFPEWEFMRHREARGAKVELRAWRKRTDEPTEFGGRFG